MSNILYCMAIIYPALAACAPPPEELCRRALECAGPAPAADCDPDLTEPGLAGECAALYGSKTQALTTPRNTTPPPSAGQSIKVLQANIGNVALGCSPFYKLCYTDVEQRMITNIAAYDPDVVFLEEVTPDWMCRYGYTNSSSQVCYNYTNLAVRDQVRRLLGWNYSVVCDWHHGWDCIAVKTDAGYFVDDMYGRSCPPGYLCGSTTFSNGSYVDGIPMNNADPYHATYYAVYNSSSYDEGFHMLYADAVVRGRTMRLIAGHPQSPGTSDSTAKQQARRDQLDQAFSQWAAGQPRVLMAGDMNVDPYRETSDLAALLWYEHVDNYDSSGNLTAAKNFWYHSGVAKNKGTWWPAYTAYYTWPIPDRTLDHMISNFAYGTCTEARIDGGSGADHRSLQCTLHFE